MDISIIIVSWNVRELLKKCLDSVIASVAKQSYNRTEQDTCDNQIHCNVRIASVAPQDAGLPRNDIDFEIIVVDNASSDGTMEMLKNNFNVISTRRSIGEGEEKPLIHGTATYKGSLAPPAESAGGLETTKKITLIVNHENRGFAAANNQGIRQAKGKYILLLNPDTEFTSSRHSEPLPPHQGLPRTGFGDDDNNTLQKVVAKMESDPSIGVLGCQLLHPDGSIQPSVRQFPTVWSQLVILTKLHHIWPSLLDKYLMKGFDYKPRPNLLLGKERGLDVVEVDQVMGAFFCVRREVFDKIGLLDQGYFIWFEEVDFCRRAKRAGYQVVYWPGTRIIHHGAQSFKQQMTIKKQWWFFKSMMRYFLMSPRTLRLASRDSG